MPPLRAALALRVVAVVFGVGISAGALNAQAPLADAAKLIAAGEAVLGAKPGEITLRQPSRLAGTLTLGAGHSLHIAAPLTVSSGSIQLAGGNEVACTAPIQVESATDLFVADGAADLNLHDCDVTVTGRSGGYFLTATRSARVTMANNHLIKAAIFNTHNSGVGGSQTTDVTLTGNSTIFPPGTGPIGIYLLYVLRGTITGNHLEGTGHGIEWWGGDANEGWHGFDAVTGTGQLNISGNTCKVPGGACVWGSDGADITVKNNTTDTCSDVCFDTEGGVRTTFTGNAAKGCANGCYAVEFESKDIVFSGNTASDEGAPGHVVVLIKHPSGRGPSHENLSVTGNNFTCATLCPALYTEGEDGFTFANNTITNGFLQGINYTNNVLIRGNTLRFTVAVGPLPAILGPALANGHHSEISGNTVVAQAGVKGDVACIAQGWSDNNNTDEMRITGNTCTGFRYGISTATGGSNPGAPHAVWLLRGNHFSGIAAANQIVHQHSSGNESYTSVP